MPTSKRLELLQNTSIDIVNGEEVLPANYFSAPAMHHSKVLLTSHDVRIYCRQKALVPCVGGGGGGGGGDRDHRVLRSSSLGYYN